MKHVFVVRLLPALAAFVLATSLGAPGVRAQQKPPITKNQAVTTLDLKGTPLRQALKLLFENAGFDYRIDADIQDRPITMVAKDMPFQTALRNLLQAGSTPEQRLTFRRDDRMYSVELRPAGETAGITDKIFLTYADASDVIRETSLFIPGGMDPPILVSADNSLLVHGPPEAISTFRDVVRLVDLPRTPVVLRVEVVGQGMNGKPLALGTLIQTLAGKEAMAEEQTIEGGMAQGSRLHVRVKPIPRGDGSFLVENSWDLSLLLTGGAKAPAVRLAKKLSTTTRIGRGETVVVGEVNADQWGGKGKLVLRLTSVPPPSD